MPRKENPGPISAQAQQDLVSEGIENYELPKSVVMKIAKSALPDDARLTKETVLSLVKGSTVFINYLAATAHDVAVSKQHKSIAASDVLKALELMEFGDLVEPLTEELKVHKASGPSTSSRSKPSNAGQSVSTGKGFSISIPPQSHSGNAHPLSQVHPAPQAYANPHPEAHLYNVDSLPPSQSVSTAGGYPSTAKMRVEGESSVGSPGSVRTPPTTDAGMDFDD